MSHQDADSQNNHFILLYDSVQKRRDLMRTLLDNALHSSSAIITIGDFEDLPLNDAHMDTLHWYQLDWDLDDGEFDGVSFLNRLKLKMLTLVDNGFPTCYVALEPAFVYANPTTIDNWLLCEQTFNTDLTVPHTTFCLYNLQHTNKRYICSSRPVRH